MNMQSLKPYAPIVLRLGLSFVFLWFGLNQLIDQTMWLSLVPSFLPGTIGIPARTIVIINGSFEIVAATLLVVGIGIRVVGTLLVLHLLTIVLDLGLNAVGIRDVGLMIAMVSVVCNGPDSCSYDR